jgi:hypothetical protein
VWRDNISSDPNYNLQTLEDHRKEDHNKESRAKDVVIGGPVHVFDTAEVMLNKEGTITSDKVTYYGQFILSTSGDAHARSVFFKDGQWIKFDNQTKNSKGSYEYPQKIGKLMEKRSTIVGHYFDSKELQETFQKWATRQEKVIPNSFLHYLKNNPNSGKNALIYSVLSQNPTLLTSLIKEDKKEDVSQSSSQSIDDRIKDARDRKEKIKQKEAEKRKRKNQSRDERMNPSRKKEEEDSDTPETFKLQKERNAWHNRYAE